jgi:hypothetical protein
MLKSEFLNSNELHNCNFRTKKAFYVSGAPNGVARRARLSDPFVETYTLRRLPTKAPGLLASSLFFPFRVSALEVPVASGHKR